MNDVLEFSTATGNCSDNIFTFTIKGTTQKSIAAGSVNVIVNDIENTCNTPGATVEVLGLRNLQESASSTSELNIQCQITTVLNNQKITISQITIEDETPVSSLNIQVNDGESISCGTTPEPAVPEPAVPEPVVPGPEEPDETDELTPQEFGDLKLKAISVSQNNVVVAITLVQDEDENKRLSDNASIKNLKLVDNGSFSQDLTCTINKGSKLSSVICTMQTAATDGSKYKLSGTDVEFKSEGDDEFGSVEIEDTEALAFTDDSESDTSSWLKNSIILFLFALLF